MEFGDITILKNICFSDGKVDHSYKYGRPCIYIGENLDNMYFIPLSDLNFNIKEKHYIIVPTKENRLLKKSRIRVLELVERPIAFYEIYGNLGYFELQKLIRALRTSYKEEDPNFKLVNELIDKYINYSDSETKNKTCYYKK